MYFSNLLNCFDFRTLEHFDTEYTLMSSVALISDHFHLKRLPSTSMLDPDAERQSIIHEGYMHWQLQPAGKLSWKKLMRRPQLEKWLYAWFLKICLPYPQSNLDGMTVHSPFNLTIFLRLLSRVQEVGYPAHWLSDIINSLCAGVITTTARPPQTLVSDVAEIKKVHPARQIWVSPWAAELSTLLALWRPLLGFGFTLPDAISPSDVYECHIPFKKDFKGDGLRMARFMLLFWDAKCGKLPLRTMRDLLLNGESAEEDENTSFKNGGIHVLSVWKYTVATKTATF